MNQIVQLDERESSLKTVGHVSYLLHLIVAVGAVVPGFEPTGAVPAAAPAGDGKGGIKGRRPSRKDRLRAAAAGTPAG